MCVRHLAYVTPRPLTPFPRAPLSQASLLHPAATLHKVSVANKVPSAVIGDELEQLRKKERRTRRQDRRARKRAAAAAATAQHTALEASAALPAHATLSRTACQVDAWSSDSSVDTDSGGDGDGDDGSSGGGSKTHHPDDYAMLPPTPRCARKTGAAIVMRPTAATASCETTVIVLPRAALEGMEPHNGTLRALQRLGHRAMESHAPPPEVQLRQLQHQRCVSELVGDAVGPRYARRRDVVHEFMSRPADAVPAAPLTPKSARAVLETLPVSLLTAQRGAPTTIATAKAQDGESTSGGTTVVASSVSTFETDELGDSDAACSAWESVAAPRSSRAVWGGKKGGEGAGGVAGAKPVAAVAPVAPVAARASNAKHRPGVRVVRMRRPSSNLCTEPRATSAVTYPLAPQSRQGRPRSPRSELLAVPCGTRRDPGHHTCSKESAARSPRRPAAAVSSSSSSGVAPGGRQRPAFRRDRTYTVSVSSDAVKRLVTAAGVPVAAAAVSSPTGKRQWRNGDFSRPVRWRRRR